MSIRERAEEAYFDSISKGHQAAMDSAVAEVIEECARVAEANSPAELYPYNPGARIAAAIRALKDKP